MGSSADDLFQIAAHEAAHAVAAIAFGLSFNAVAVDPEDGSGGITMIIPLPTVAADGGLRSVVPIVAVALAGPIGGALMGMDPAELERACKHDYEDANAFATAVAGDDPKKKVEILLVAAKRAETIVNEQWDVIREVAEALAKHRVLTEEQVRVILQEHGATELRSDRRVWRVPIGWPNGG